MSWLLVTNRSARLAAAMFVAVASVGCKDCNPVTPSVAPATHEVWMSPNIGSRDFLDLFANPNAWASARQKITTIGFSGSNVLDDPCTNCGVNTLHGFVNVVPGGAFRWLASHQLKIALQAPSVKAWDCTAATTTGQAVRGLANIAANGGTAAFVELDEPFTSGLPPNQSFAAAVPTCGYTVDQTAAQVRNYVTSVQAAAPGAQIGLIEPYPYFSAAQIESFIAALTGVGVPPAFFHLDYDESFQTFNPAPDFIEFRSFFAARNIPFGIVIIGTNGTSNVTAVNGALAAALRISQILGVRSQPHVLFESWLSYPPSESTSNLLLYPDNLPETSPDTMTGLVDTVFATMP